MRLLVSGATRTIARLLADPVLGSLASTHLGHLVSPAAGNRLESLLSTGLPIAIDNGAFAQFQAGQSFDWRGYQRYIDRVAERYYTTDLRQRLLWCVIPDVVADHQATRRAAATWRMLQTPAMAALPWAWVAQDGATPRHTPGQGDPRGGPWVGIRCCFIGGSTHWKESPAAHAMIRFAQRHGRLVHVGRVNSYRRLAVFDHCDIDSCDGGQFSMFPDTYIARWLQRLAYRQAQLEDL